MVAKNLSLAILIFLTFMWATKSQAYRLACSYFDKNNPNGGNFASKLFSPSLPFIYAKNQANQEDFLKGTLKEGFFEVENMTQEEAKYFCNETLKTLFPGIAAQLMNMSVKPCLWSKHVPTVFLKDDRRKYTKLVIIGDSLSDQGRLREIYKFVPSNPYFAGRFTNGGVWVDYLQEITGITILNLATAGSLSGKYQEINLNGAKPWKQRLPDDISLYFSGTFQDQFASFQKGLNGNLIKPDTIFLIWGGSNDYLAFIDHPELADPFLDSPEHPWGYNKVINRVTDNIILIMQNLYALGARNFIIPNLPNLGKLPRMFENTSYAPSETSEKRLVSLSEKMNKVSTEHNDALAQKIAEMRKKKDIKIAFVDIVGELARASMPLSFLEKEISYQGSKVTIGQACYQNYSYYPMVKTIPIVCQEDKAFFWDGVHPTTFGHGLMAAFIQEAAARENFFNQASINDYLAVYRSQWQKNASIEAKQP